MDNYEFLFEIGQGITLPKSNYDYKVQVSLNNLDWKTQIPKEKKGEYVRWSERSEVITKWSLPKNPLSVFSASAAEIGNNKQEQRIYIYLLDDDDVPICFWHGLLSEF